MKAVTVFLMINCLFAISTFAQAEKETTKNSNQEKTITKASETTPKIEVKSGETRIVDTLPIGFPRGQIKRGKYRIGFDDTLQIAVTRHPDLNATVSVNEDGRIYLPRIKEPIVAVCKTERELQVLITELYKKDYLRNPFVSVRTLHRRSQPFSVMGAVNKPGNFYLGQRVRLLNLLALAGGQDVEKFGTRVHVARMGSLFSCNPKDDDNDVKFFAYHINDVVSGKDNPWMQPGDVVTVLEAQEAYVVGEVVEPTKILLKEDVTLSEAIARAGGLGPTAKTTKVVIQRKEGNRTRRTQLVFNLKDIKARKIDDPILKANDIIEVSTSRGKVLKRSLWKMVTDGLPNIFYRLPL